MTTNTRTIEASPDEVWEVLADGWLYPLWVVGATRIRGVDDTWPAVGSKLYHSAGVWPLVIDDNTEVLQVQPGRSLRLRARGWPAGEAEVVITLAPEASRTRVEIVEDVVKGLGVLVPKFLRHPMIKWRNTEALDRFASLAEGR